MLKEDRSTIGTVNRFRYSAYGRKHIRHAVMHMCQAVHRYAKPNNKYMKNYDQNKELYLIYWDENNRYGWAMFQNYLLMVLKGKIINLVLMKNSQKLMVKIA